MPPENDVEIEMNPQKSTNGTVYGPDSSRENNWAMACHLSAFLGYILPLGNVLGPLAVWLFKGKEFPRVQVQGKESLNFQISITLYFLVAGLLSVAVIGYFLMVAISLFSFVVIIIASVKARKQEQYRYPLAIRLIK